MLISIAEIFMLVLVMVFAVPALTRGAVDVPHGGFFRALIAVLLIGLINEFLWVAIAILTVGSALFVDFITYGLVALFVNAFAFVCTARIAPSVLYVRSFGAGLGAALVTTLASYVIHNYVIHFIAGYFG